MANSTKISEYSTTAANNTSIDSIDIDENCAASGINNAIRSVLKHQADAFTQGTPIALDQTNNRVGIGTTSPNEPLEVVGGATTMRLHRDNASGGGGIDFYNNTQQVANINAGSGTLTFSADPTNGAASSYISLETDGTERMRIDSNGDIIAKTADARIGSDAGSIEYGTSTANSVRFYTSDTERVRITTAGKFGIGETAPLGTAHIRTSDASITSVATNADELVLENNGDCGMTIASSTTATGNINFIDSGDINIGRIQYQHSTNQMDFRTNDSVRMSIRSGGEVNIGSLSSVPSGANGQTRLTVRQNQGTDAVFIDRTADIDSNYRDLVRFARNGTTVGQIKARNNAVQYNTTSDARLKENVEDMTGAIDRVKTLKPKRYSWIVDDLDAPNIDGFLAHEAQAVVPDAVSGTQNEVDDDGNPVYQGIDHGLLVPLLTGALKEAITKIETLETEMTALKARVTALEA